MSAIAAQRMKLGDAMICWTPANMRGPAPATRQGVCVGPHPDTTGWSVPYVFSTGACEEQWRGLSDADRLTQLLILFTTIAALDGVPASEVHRAFLLIDEYRITMESAA